MGIFLGSLFDSSCDRSYDLERNDLGRGTGFLAEAVNNRVAHGIMCCGGCATSSIRSRCELIVIPSSIAEASIIVVSQGIVRSIIA